MEQLGYQLSLVPASPGRPEARAAGLELDADADVAVDVEREVAQAELGVDRDDQRDVLGEVERNTAVWADQEGPGLDAVDALRVAGAARGVGREQADMLDRAEADRPAEEHVKVAVHREVGRAREARQR